MERQQIRDILGSYFDYSFDFNFIDLIQDVIDRIDDFNDDNDINCAIDDATIYYDDQWTILKHYCSPSDANYNDAMEQFTIDVYNIVEKIKEQL